MAKGREQFRSIVIFGAGKAGENALHHLRQTHNVLGFIDNASHKQGTQVEGLPVMSPSDLKSHEFDDLYIASEFFESIRDQLIEQHGVNENCIKVLPSYMLSPVQFGDDKQVNDFALATLFCLNHAFSAAELPFFIDAGTLLGIYRDGALIPWDDDLDLAVHSTSISHTKAVLTEVLPELNQLTGGHWGFDEHYADKPYGAVKKGDIRCFKLSNQSSDLKLPMVDIFIKYIENESMDYTLASRGITVPARHMFNRESIDFKGSVLSLPSDPEGYLEAYYGDWRTPVKSWDLSMIKAAKVHD